MVPLCAASPSCSRGPASPLLSAPRRGTEAEGPGGQREVRGAVGRCWVGSRGRGMGGEGQPSTPHSVIPETVHQPSAGAGPAPVLGTLWGQNHVPALRS